MNVLFVSHSCRISGGANRSLLSLMIGLREKYGIVPTVLIPAGCSEFEEQCIDNGIEVICADYHSCCTVYRKKLSDVLRWLKILFMPLIGIFEAIMINRVIHKDIDLVYSNERMIVVGAFIAKIRKVPHIWHVRSFGKENTTYYAPYYYRLMDKLSDRIVLISKALLSTFSEHISDSKLRLVHNGIQYDDYSVEQTEHDGFNLLLAGRIVPQKGHLDAVKALKILSEHPEMSEVRLCFAGEIPSYERTSYYKELCDCVEAMDLRDRICFLGEVKDMRKLRKTTDVELVCSWNEAFGRVSVEAMCASIPVIGTDAGGTSEIVEDGVTGFLYAPGNAEMLAEKITFLFTNPDRAKAMGRCGENRAKHCFSIEGMCEKVKAVIDELT